MLIYGHDAEISKWVGDRIDHADNFDPCIAIGVVSTDGRLIAGIVYNGYQPDFGTIEVSIAAISPMWARRKTIAELLRYPFEQLGCYRVYNIVPADNAAAIAVSAHIGFTREAILAAGFGKGRNAVLSRMLFPEYKRLYQPKVI